MDKISEFIGSIVKGYVSVCILLAMAFGLVISQIASELGYDEIATIYKWIYYFLWTGAAVVIGFFTYKYTKKLK